MASGLDFHSQDPGAVQHGNFINYYQFNSVDERLKMLPTASEIWLSKCHTVEPYLLLDIGCNAGNLTQRLYQFLRDGVLRDRSVHVLGVDIDKNLIERAEEANEFPANVHYLKSNVMNTTEFNETIQSFLSKHQREQFDAVCCFSITMWIHLNHDDPGLQDFLRTVHSLGALVVIEPQAWKCYQTAERRLKKSGKVFPLFLKLKWRSNVEQEIQCFLETELHRRKVFESSPTIWKRRICFYR